MPVIRFGKQSDDATSARLVSRLAEVLATDPAAEPNGEPLVVELPMFKSNRLQAVVVWSEWDRVPWAERGQLIVNAYSQAAPDRVSLLTLVTGLSWDEADSNAFFKYKVVPAYRAGEANDAAVRNAMIEEGAYVAPSGVRLRFFDRAAAEIAHQRLTVKVPNAHWALASIERLES